MPGRLLIRADAYPAIGAGHVMRCLALGQYWQDTGGSVSLVACRLVDGIRDRLEAEGIETIVTDAEIGSPADLEATIEAARSRGALWVVLDGYRFGVEHQRMLRQAGLKVLAIDDNAEMGQFECELVLNQNIHATPELYAGRCSPETELLLGTRHALLRREFRRLGDQRKARRVPPQVGRVMVTLGGGDQANVTARVMRALGQLADLSALHVEVIAGGANPHYDPLTELAESLGGRFQLVRNAADMPQRIAEADLAVTAGGSTCWEMAYLGLPNVVIVLADNQRACAAGLDAQGCSVSLGWHENCDEARIAEAFANLADDPKRRADMSRAGMELVDGEGASRTVTHMDAGNRDRLRLRPVHEDDCRQVWEWSNDKAVRENAFHSKPISWEEHCRWFAHHVHSEDSWLYICENCHGTPVGMVRFHRLEQEPEACDVSIVVDPLRRGEGIGSEILLMGQQALLASSDIRRVYAWVLEQNTTSQRLFENVGYRLQQTAERMEKQARLYVFENGLTRRQT